MRIPELLVPATEPPTVDGPEARRRRRVVTGVAIGVGTALLAATLRVPDGSAWFTVLGLLVAATWTIGSIVSGPIPFQPNRRVAWHTFVGPVITGVAAFGTFLAAYLVARHLPLVGPAVDGVLATADAGSTALVLFAAHTYGLVRRDVAALAEAAELLAATPRRLARASALEDHGVLLIEQHHRTTGVDILTEALQLYVAVGAEWDASRVRRRLRHLGVRRRLSTSERPTTGWEGLTRAELAVVELIAGGLTNRAAAAQLFLSPHTVSMHLRHVFTKLGITSRVELTRIVLERKLAA